MERDSLGKDAEIITNECGGMQGKTDFSFHLLDSPAMFALTEVLAYGASKYKRDNWRLIDTESHLNHAMIHIFAYMSGNTQDDHLPHAFCRLMMALAMDIRPKYLGHVALGEAKAFEAKLGGEHGERDKDKA